MIELSNVELMTLIPYYTNAVPRDIGVLGPITDTLWSRGLLYIHDRAAQGRNLTSWQQPVRYQVMITNEGYEAVAVQEPIRKVWACVSINLMSEALVFMGQLPFDELPELLVCKDETIRREARERMEICHGVN